MTAYLNPDGPFGRDGRRIVDPPCDYGHTRQAMECPSCSERLTGAVPDTDWIAWYERRSGRKRVQP